MICVQIRISLHVTFAIYTMPDQMLVWRKMIRLLLIRILYLWIFIYVKFSLYPHDKIRDLLRCPWASWQHPFSLACFAGLHTHTHIQNLMCFSSLEINGDPRGEPIVYHLIYTYELNWLLSWRRIPYGAMSDPRLGHSTGKIGKFWFYEWKHWSGRGGGGE